MTKWLTKCQNEEPGEELGGHGIKDALREIKEIKLINPKNLNFTYKIRINILKIIINIFS